MNTHAAAQDAFSGDEVTWTTCQYLPCGKSFQPRRAWQTFCSGRCRTAFHAAKDRAEAIQRAAPALFEALRRIAAGELAEGETPAGVATAAVKDLRAP